MKTSGGSVKRARERVQVGKPYGQDELAQSREIPCTTSQRSATPTTPKKFSGLSTPGASISRPTPLLHRTPPTDDDSMRKANNSPIGESTYGKGSPPQRPPRPSYVPSILDASCLQEQTPVYQYRQPLPPPSEATTTSSRPSTSSSMGSIPEFPVPSIPLFLSPQQPRRGINLGPPPSARRGASSYYSQSSYVAPIPEEVSESAKNSRSSFASSYAIPISWTDGELGDDGEDEEAYGEDGRSSAMTDHDESAGLVRQASLGKRHKPSLTTIKCSDGLDKGPGGSVNEPDHPMSENPTASSKLLSELAAELSSANNNDDMARKFAQSAQALATFKELEIAGDGEAYDSDSHSESSVPSPIDPTVRQILGGLEKGGAINPGTTPPITSPSSLKTLDASKRPTRFQVNEAKDAGFRGSLTSLPDLIRRATKVATNLDKGKTASRLGLFDLLYASEPKAEIGDPTIDQRSRAGSLTHMLASFPTPGPNMTPTTTSFRATTRWPSRFATDENLVEKSYTDLKPDVTSRKPRRTCCGLPLWIFSMLMMGIVMLIAAAVIVPVALIVLPRQNSQSAATTATDCKTSTPCANGGISTLTGTTCGCVCANGYYGSSCDQSQTSACTTISFNSDAQDSSFENATIGTSIPRLLYAAESNFSIPLNSAVLLSQFNANNLSCSAENALVMFNEKSQRRDVSSGRYAAIRDHKEVNAIVAARQASASTTITLATATSTAAVITTNGIVLAGTTTASTSTTAIATGTITPTAVSSPSASALPSGQIVITQQVLDFSRIVVLYVLQESSLNSAVEAQGYLQSVLMGNSFKPGPVSIGNNVTANFRLGTVILGNGTTVGGEWSVSSPAQA